jgi:hypothetical protein
VVFACCEEGLGWGVLEGEVGTGGDGAGWFGEGEGAVRGEGHGGLPWFEECLGQDEGADAV